jgi:CheY-like chemotaxis protein
MKTTRRKPRVLLADDHPAMLDSVSMLLARDFEIAGTAADGWQVIAQAPHLEPDVLVLDVNMPGLGGIEALRALRQTGSRVPAVFLSMARTEDVVGEAFRSGGRGYVVKSRASDDLASALDHVLHGRLFLPSLAALPEIHDGATPLHAMHVYDDDGSLLESVASLFDTALRSGGATCVFATDDLREGLADRLRRRGWDLDAPPVRERYRDIRAADALSGFMRGGLPDASLMTAIAAELEQYRRAVGRSAAQPLTIFGNMVRVLADEGNKAGMFALEDLWNTVTAGLPFVTVCGYCKQGFKGETDWSHVCAAHGAVTQTTAR